MKNKAESRSSFKGICPPAETVELDEGVENSGFSLNDEFMYEGYIPTEKFDEEGKKEFSVPLERLDGDEDMAKLPGSPGTKSPKKSALHSPVKSKTISQSPRAPSPGKSIASSQRTRVNTAHSRKSPVPADVTADENQNAIKKLELTASEDSDGTKTNQEPTTQSLSDKQVAHPQDSTVSEHKSILPEVFPNAPTEKPQNTLVDEPKEQTSFFAFLSMSPKVVRVDSISIQKHVEVANEPDREQRTNDTEDLSESNSTKQQEAEISPQKMDIEITSKLSESISGPVPVPSPVDVPQVKVRPPSGLSRSVGSMAAISKPTQANLKKNAKSSEALRNSARPTAKTKPVTSPRTGKSQSGIKLQSAAGSKSAVTATRSKSIAANSKGSREMLQSVNSRKLSGSKELMKSGISVSRGSKDILKSSDGKVSRSNLGSTALYGSTKVSKSMGNRENSKSFGSKQNLKSTGSIQNLKSTTSRGSKTPLLRGSQRDVVAKTSITVVKKNTSSSQRIASRSLDTLASKLSPPQSQNARKVNSTSKIASKINHSVKNAPQARSPKLKQAPSQKSETKLKKVEGNQSVRSVKQSQTALEPKNSNFSVVALEPRESLLNPEASDFSGGVTSGAPSELSLSQAPSMYQMEIPVAGQEYQMEATSRSDKFLPFLPPKAPEITETPAYKYQNRVMSDDGEIVWSSLDPYSVEPEKQAVVSVQELVTIQEPEKVLGRRLSDDGEIIWSSATEAQT